MCDRNAKSQCILIKLRALVFESICERTTKFHEKILFHSWVINLKHRRQNIFVSNTALVTAVTSPEVTLCCENPFDVLAIGDGVGCCKQSGAYQLVLHWSRYKGERPVLSRCLASSTASTSHTRPVWRLLYFSTEPLRYVHRARENVQLLTCETPDFIAPALWPANSPDLNPVYIDYQTWGKHRSRMHDVNQLKSRMIEQWEHRCSSMKRSRSGVHVFELDSNTDFSYVWYLYRRTPCQSYVCTIACCGHFCFEVTPLNPQSCRDFT